jgi:hypothetical protein
MLCSIYSINVRVGHGSHLYFVCLQYLCHQRFASLIKELTKSNSTIHFLPKTVDDPRQRKPDITTAKAKLGWSPQVWITVDCGYALYHACGLKKSCFRLFRCLLALALAKQLNTFGKSWTELVRLYPLALWRQHHEEGDNGLECIYSNSYFDILERTQFAVSCSTRHFGE